MKIWLESVWKSLRQNQDLKISVQRVKEHAIDLVKEAVQCAAVCERFIETIEREEKKDERLF